MANARSEVVTSCGTVHASRILMFTRDQAALVSVVPRGRQGGWRKRNDATSLDGK